MPNPTGVNQGNVFQPEQPYGQIKRLQELIKGAPLPPNPSLTAPDRAKKRATRPAKAAAPAPAEAMPPAGPLAPGAPTPYPVIFAQIVSGLPGADGSLPNVTWLAEQAKANG